MTKDDCITGLMREMENLRYRFNFAMRDQTDVETIRHLSSCSAYLIAAEDALGHVRWHLDSRELAEFNI